MNIGNYAVPAFIFFVLVFAAAKRTNAYEHFISGASEGIHIAIKLLPSLLALVVAVEMMSASGLSDAIAAAVTPAAESIGLPPDAVSLILLRPVSGSGSTAILTGIFESIGPDSKAGFISSVLCGSTETTFYAMSVYYGSCGVKKTGMTIVAALSADFVAVAVSLTIANLIFH